MFDEGENGIEGETWARLVLAGERVGMSMVYMYVPSRLIAQSLRSGIVQFKRAV